MRIAIVCSYYPWPPSVGGVETIVRIVSTELAKRGHEVHVVTTPFSVTPNEQVADYGIEEKDGVIIHKLRPGRFKIGYARALKGLKEEIERIKPEIVHSHNLHPHLFQLAKWKNKLGYKLVAELHHPAIILDFFIQKLLMPLATMMVKNSCEAVDAFIAHTNLEREWLNSKGIHRSKIALVRFPAIPSGLMDDKINSENVGDIIYLGRIAPRKGLHILIEALHEVKETFNHGVRATIAGPSDLDYLSRLTKLVKRLEVGDNITFKGFVTEEEKYRLIKSHKVLALPSLKDYHPIVLLEAQALGVPVIATKVGAVPEMLIDGETGLLVKPNDEHELAKAIKTLLKDEELRKQFSTRAREFVRGFAIEKAVERLEGIYYAIFNEGNQSA